MSCLFSIFISDFYQKPLFDYFGIMGQPEVEIASNKIFLVVNSCGDGTTTFSGHIFWSRVLSHWLEVILKKSEFEFFSERQSH